MNKVFKVIWCQATQTWVAASEFSRAKGKSKTKSVKTAVASALLLTAGGASAASVVNGDTTITGVANGDTKEVVVYGKDIAVGGGSQTDNTLVGSNITTHNNAEKNTAVGNQIVVNTVEGTLIGHNVSAKGEGTVGIGKDVNATQTAVAVGTNVTTKSNKSVAIGHNVNVSAYHGSIAIGYNIDNQAGTDAQNDANGSMKTPRSHVMIGNGVKGRGNGSITIATQGDWLQEGSASQQTWNHGNDSIAIGANVHVGEENQTRGGMPLGAVAIGSDSRIGSGTTYTVSLGDNAAVYGSQSSAVGRKAIAYSNNSVAMGVEAVAGSGTQANGTSSYAYKDKAENISGNFATSVGAYSTASHEDSSAFGRNAKAAANKATALGTYAVSNQEKATAVGFSAHAYANFSSSLGSHAETYADHAIAIGGGNGSSVDSKSGSAIAMAEKSIAIGTFARSGTSSSIAIGDNAQIFDRNEFNQGWNNPYPGMNSEQSAYTRHGREASFTNAMAIGSNTRALERSAIAFGHNAKSTGIQAFAGGYNASTTAEDALALGSFSKATAQSAVAVGNTSTASAENAIAMGTNSLSNAASTVAISTNSFAGGENAIAIGKDSYAAGKKLSDLNSGATTTLNDALNNMGTVNHSNIKNALNNAKTSANDATYAAIIDKIIADLDAGSRDNTGPFWSGANALAFVKSSVSTATVPLNSAIAIGDSSKSIAEKSITLGYHNLASGVQSIAVGTSNIVKGDHSGAFGDPSIVEGTASYTFGNDNVVGSSTTGAFVLGNRNRMGAKPTYTAQDNTARVDNTQPLEGIPALGDATLAVRDVSGSVAIGNDNTVTSKDTFILGSSINTYNAITTGGGTVENSVYLGKDSTANVGAAEGTKNLNEDGTPGVSTSGGNTGKVNNATVAGVDYQGFQGNTAVGIVTVGSAGKERRIQNVAAGEISSTSTDAINGSQLYLITKAIGDVSDNNPFSYTVKEGDQNVPVTSIDGKFYKDKDLDGLRYDPATKTFYDIATGAPATAPTAVDAGDINVSSNVDDTNSPDTLNNIKGSLPQTLNEGDKAQNANTTPNPNGVAATGDTFTKAQTAPADIAPIYNNAATVGDVLNAGWNLQGDGKAVDFVKPYDTVNFIDSDTTNITVESADGKTSTIKVDVITTKLTNSDGEVDTPQGVDSNKLVNAEAVAEAINNSGWLVSIGRNDDGFEDQDAYSVDGDADLITMGETATFMSGKNIKVGQNGANITYATLDDVEFNSVQLGKDKEGPKLTVDANNNIKVGDKDGDNPVNITNLKGNLDPAYNDGDLKEEDGKLNVNTPAEAGDITKAQAGPGTAKAGEIYNNAATVGDVLNAGWNLQGNGKAVDFVKPYDTVNFVDGTGTTVVAESADGKTSTIKINTLTQYTTEDGTPVTVIDGKGYPVGSIKAQNGNVYPAGTELGEDGNPKDPAAATENVLTDAPQISLVDVNGVSKQPTVLGNVAAGTKTLDGTNRGDKKAPEASTAIDANANPKLKEAYEGLADLNNSNDNNALTVADAKNLGWVVSSDKTTGDLGAEYADDVRNANEVRFVGTGLATVSGETDANGVRTITVDVKANESQQPVVYTDKDGNKVIKAADGKFYPADSVVAADGSVYPAGTALDANGMPKDQAATPLADGKDAGDVIASMNNGDDKTTEPMKLVNVAGTLAPTYNLNDPKAKKGGKADKDTPAEAGDITKQMVNPFDKDSTTPATAEELASVYNNAATVGDVLNAGWNLQENSEARDFVKPYDTVNFVNGQGTTVKIDTSDDGRVSNVRIDTLATLVDKDGNPLIQIGDQFYKAEDIDPKTGQPKVDNGNVAQPVDQAANGPFNVNISNPTAKDAETTTPIQVGNVAAGANTYAADKGSDEKTPLVKVGENYYTPDDFENGKLKPTATPADYDAATALNNPAATAREGLADLNHSNPTNVMTVADAKNLGWVVSSDKKTTQLDQPYADDVRNADEVRFVGTGLATVSGATEDNVRIITVDVKAQQQPVVYTDAAGNKLIKGDDGKFYPADSVNIGGKYYPAGTTADNVGTATPATATEPKDVIASMNDGDDSTTAPMNLANVKGNLPQTVNTGDKKEAADDSRTLDKAPDALADAPTRRQEAPTNVADIYNNAATVGDVLNAGWNLSVNGDSQVDFVKPYDTVNFNNGKGTLASVESKDGKVSNVTFNIDNGEAKALESGALQGTSPEEKADLEKAVKDAEKAAEDAQKDVDAKTTELEAAKQALTAAPDDQAAKDKVAEAEKALADAQAEKANKDSLKAKADRDLVAVDNKVATVENLVNAVNKSGFKLKASEDGGSLDQEGSAKKDLADDAPAGTKATATKGELINPGDTVEMVAGKNLVVKHDEEGKITYSLAKDINVNSVTVETTGPKGEKGSPITMVSSPNNTLTLVAPQKDENGDVTGVAPVTVNGIKGNLAPTYNAGDIKQGDDGKLTTEAADAPTKSQTAPSAEEAAKMHNNAATVGDVLNAGWNLKENGGDRDFVKPYDTVEFINGAGTTVTVKTADDGKSSTVKVDVATANISPESPSSANEGKVIAAPKDLVDKLSNAEKALADAKKELADAEKALADNKDQDKVAELTKAVEDAKAKANNPDLEKAVEDAKKAIENDNSGNGLATAKNVADAINASGWKVTSGEDGGKTTGTTEELINPSETVTFKSGKNIELKQEGNDFTYSLADNINVNSVTVETTGPDGKKGAPITMVSVPSDVDGEENSLAFIAPKKEGDKIVGTAPVTIKNINGSLPVTYNQGDNEIIEGRPTGNKITDVKSVNAEQPAPSADEIAKIYNNAATVGDVLNAGWNLKENGTAKDFVKPYDTVNFVNGVGTTVTVKTADDGKSSTVKVDVATANISPESPSSANEGKVIAAPKELVEKLAEAEKAVADAQKAVADAEKALAENKDSAKEAELKQAVEDAKAKAADPELEKAVADAKDAIAKDPSGNGLATAKNVADAINASGWKVTSGEDGGKTTGTTEELINPSETVTFKSGKNIELKQEGNDFTYSLAKDINVNSVTVETEGPNGKGSPITMVSSPNNTLTLVAPQKDENGDVTGVAPVTVNGIKGNLAPTYNAGDIKQGDDGKLTTEAADAPTKSQTAPSAEEAAKMHNNAATVGDVLNAGWNLQGNGEAKDFVKPYDTVNFVNGEGTTATVITNPDGKSSDIVYSVNVDGKTTEITYTNAAGETIYKLADGTYNTQKDGKGNKVEAKDITGSRVSAILPTTSVGGEEVGGNVNFVDGNSTTVTVKKVDGKTPEIKVNVKTGDITPNADGSVSGPTTTELLNKLKEAEKAVADAKTKLADAEKALAENQEPSKVEALKQAVAAAKEKAEDPKLAKAVANAKDAIAKDESAKDTIATAKNVADAINKSGFTLTAQGKNGSVVNPGETVDMKNEDGNIVISKSADNNDVVYNLARDINVDSVQFGPYGPKVQQGLDGSIQVGDKDNAPVAITNVAGNLPGAKTAGDTLGAAPQKARTEPENVADIYNNAATVGDVLNAGWNLQGNGEAKDFVKSYDTVNFVDGEGTTATVITKPDGKSSDIVYSVNVDGKTTEITYTNKEGDTIYKLADGTYNTQKDGKGTVIDPKAITGSRVSAIVPTTSVGGNQVSGNVNFENSTTTEVKAENGNITVNVKTAEINATPNGNVEGPAQALADKVKEAEKAVADANQAVVNAEKAKADADKAVVDAQKALDDNKDAEKAEALQKALDEAKAKANDPALTQAIDNAKAEAAKPELAEAVTKAKEDLAKDPEANKVATAQNVADAINASGWKVTSGEDGGKTTGTTEELINPSETVTFKSGKNIELKQEGNNFTYSLAKDIDVNSVKAQEVTAGKVTADEVKVGDVIINNAGINAGNKVISNVANGVAPTDAVNVSQLNGVVNNINNRINDIDDNYRAGIAGSAALVNIPQVTRPGANLLGVGLGHFKGESAIAVGFSSASDNERLIFKISGSANTQGDYSIGSGMGWQW